MEQAAAMFEPRLAGGRIDRHAADGIANFRLGRGGRLCRGMMMGVGVVRGIHQPDSAFV